MTWFILSLIAILFWSGSDLFSKLGSRPDDKYSHWKMVMAVGVVMGAHAFFLIATGTPFSISDIVTYLGAAPMSPDARQLSEELVSQTRELAGAGNAALGQVNPEQASGAAIIAARDQAALPLNEQIADFRQFIEDVAAIWFELWAVYAPVPLGLPPWQISAEELGKLRVEIRIDVAPNSPLSHYAQEQALEKLFDRGAISFEEREAKAYDAAAVEEAQKKKGASLPCGCPGSQSRNIQRQDAPAVETPQAQQMSCLSQWPVQIKLVPVNAPYFDGARLLIAADCTAYAYAAFHEQFIKGHITLVGCPKLDGVDYAEKLTEIIRENDIKSVTVVRMEVPCCGGLEMAAKTALQQSGKFIPWQVVTVTVDGRLKEE